MNTENWLPVVGYEGHYEISDLGRVRSLKGGRYGFRILRGGINSDGYHGFSLSLNGHSNSLKAHVMVLTAFVGPRSPGMEGCHFDGDRMNNRLDNLRWDTRLANQHDRIRQGTHNAGERHSRAKFSDGDIQRVVDLWANGVKKKVIGEWLGISRRYVRALLSGSFKARTNSVRLALMQGESSSQ